MLIHRTYMKFFVTLAFASLTLFANSAFGQTTAAQTAIRQTEVVPEQPKPGKQENKSAATDDVADLKAENAAIRELLRKMEEQQKTLLAQVDKLQRRLDGSVTTDVQ